MGSILKKKTTKPEMCYYTSFTGLFGMLFEQYGWLCERYGSLLPRYTLLKIATCFVNALFALLMRYTWPECFDFFSI